MEFTEKELKKIKKLASLFFTHKEIAIAMILDVDEFYDYVRDPESNVYKYYQAGKIKTEVKIRKQVIQMAEMGSPVAQQETSKLASNQKIKENA